MVGRETSQSIPTRFLRRLAEGNLPKTVSTVLVSCPSKCIYAGMVGRETAQSILHALLMASAEGNFCLMANQMHLCLHGRSVPKHSHALPEASREGNLHNVSTHHLGLIKQCIYTGMVGSETPKAITALPEASREGLDSKVSP